MNNNRGNNNNRRRGRGPNNNGTSRPQGGSGGSGGGGGQGGGQPLNRIDSRARGNAPQMLEKYKKLAQDAHLNGDRVTAEYYLQFADHYFRVIADTRLRQEEQRRPREAGWQDDGSDNEEAEYVDPDFPTFDQPPPAYARREERPREDRPSAERPGSDRNGPDRPRDDRPREDRPREDRPREDRPREDRSGNTAAVPERSPRQDRYAPDRFETGESDAAPVADAPADEPSFEPAENPFVRENRGTRGLRPRREDRHPRAQTSDSGNNALIESTFDAAILPPAISAGRDSARAEAPAADGEEAPVKPRRTRKPRAAEGDIETVA